MKVGSQIIDTRPSVDYSRAALDFAYRLLSGKAAAEDRLDGLVRGLAEAFGVPAAGLADWQSGSPRVGYRSPEACVPTPLPWEVDADLLTRLRQAPEVVGVKEGTFAFLTAPAPLSGGGWIVWVASPEPAKWKESEKAALSLIAQVLVKSAAGNRCPWGQQLERAARQQQLEQAAALSRRLAHDFGNILTAILGFGELGVAQHNPSVAVLLRYLNEINRSAQAGSQLTHQLQMFSRRQVSSNRPGSLPAVLEEEETRLRTTDGATIRCQMQLEPNLPAVALDQEPLRQVVAALLDNAREAVGPEGTITVAAHQVMLSETDCLDHFGTLRPGPHVAVCVSDNGPGLSEEAQRQLFVEPFYTSKARRRGFGLAVAYGMLSAHHGGLSVANGAAGGVEARVLLPVAGTREAAGRGAGFEVRRSTGMAPEQGHGERVLVVDDDPMILQFVSRTLEQAGYHVNAVSNAEEALTTYAGAGTEPFKLVLSDVVMPQVNGVDLARRLLLRDAQARVLFMSSQVSAEFARTDFAPQRFELLSKPFRPEELLCAVRSALIGGEATCQS